MLLRYMPFVLLLACQTVESAAQVNTTDIAHKAYTLALAKVTAHRKAMLNGQAISYEEINKDQSGDGLSVTQILHLDADGVEHVAQNTDRNSNGDEASLNWQSSILVDPSRYPENPTLIAETETAWVFSIPTKIDADVGDVEQEVDSAKVNNVLSSALMSELTISKLSPQFVSQKIYAKHPFKPDSLVKVNEFKVQIGFVQAWQGGPWVTESISRILKGSYAFFMSVDESSETRYENFAAVNKKPEQ